MSKSLPIMIATLLLLAGCQKNIKVDLPSQSSKLVVNAVVESGAQISLRLSRSLSLKETGKGLREGVAGARIVLYVDGQPADTLQGGLTGDSSEYISAIVAEAGKKYRLHIEAAGFESVDASAEGMAAVPLTGYRWTRQARQSIDAGTEDELSITFTDPGSTTDFYIVSISPASSSGQESDLYSSSSNCAFTADPSVQSSTGDPLGEGECLHANSIFMRDNLFGGKEKTLRVYLPGGMLEPWQPGGPGGPMQYSRVTLYRVSEDFQSFLKSYKSAYESSGNPFVEPFNVTSNVRGGYGVFAILASDSSEVMP